MNRETGIFRVDHSSGEAVRWFIPHPLPPSPPLLWSEADVKLREDAAIALGRLDGAAMAVPDVSHLIYALVRAEAVLSSQIEGTQSTLDELLTNELGAAPGVPADSHVAEISRYVATFDYALAQLRDTAGLPLSLRLLREMHARLLADGRGGDKAPGEFRRTPVWIGGSRPGNAMFVPPPPDEVPSCLDAWERFLHNPQIPTLVKAGLAHVQFETIHPFLDGNGRLGRMLIPLLLCHEGVLSEPVLYPSLYFKRNRREYYARLQAVRDDGDWEGWMRFFLTALRDTATTAVQSLRRARALFEADQDRIRAADVPAGVFSVFEVLQHFPIVHAKRLTERTGMAPTTVHTHLDRLTAMGITREITGRKRDRIYAYEAYMAILREGTEPLPRGGD